MQNRYTRPKNRLTSSRYLVGIAAAAIVVLGVAAVGVSQLIYDDTIENATKLIQSGDKDGATTMLRRLAASGDADAETYLGGILLGSAGGDPAEARKLFRSAAGRGQVFAQLNAGLMAEKGEGGPADDVEAVQWYRAAAEKGLPAAQVMLGMRYFDGRGVARNHATAEEWLRKAAERGDPDGQTMIGVILVNGTSGHVDKTQAAMWFMLAAEQNHPDAKANADRLKADLSAEQWRVAEDWAKGIKAAYK